MMAASFGKTSISGTALPAPAPAEKPKNTLNDSKADTHAEGKKGKGKNNAN